MTDEQAELAAYEAQLRGAFPGGVDLPPANGTPPAPGTPNVAAPPAPGQDPAAANPGVQFNQQPQPARTDAMPIPQYERLPDENAPLLPPQQPQPRQQPGPQFQFQPQQQPHQPQQPGQQPGGPVPAAVMLAERRRRQEADHENAQLRQSMQQMQQAQARQEERLAMLGEVMSRGQQSELERLNQGGSIPSYDEDPERHIQAVNELAERKANERIKELEEKVTKQQEMIDGEVQSRQIKQAVNVQSQAFEREFPDFYNAYEFMRQSRTRELVEQGFAPADVERHVNDEEEMMARAHLASGRSVPEAFYRAAMTRGYQPQIQPRPQPQPAPQQQPHMQHMQPQNMTRPMTPQPAPAAYPQAYAPPPAPVYPQQMMQPQPQVQAPMPMMPQPQLMAPAPQPQMPVPYQAPYAVAPTQPDVTWYAGQPSLDNIQAGMMAGSHLADTAASGMHDGGMPSLEQLDGMNEEQLMQNMAAINAHIQGLQAAGH